jgi:caffeoyl-CoA O-methyltransferase
MLRNVMIVSLVAATLAAVGWFADFGFAADAEVVDVTAVAAVKSNFLKGRSREERQDLDKANAKIRQLEAMTKDHTRIIDDLRKKNQNLQAKLAKAEKSSRARRGPGGFNFGGAPDIDGPPVPKDDKEKKALTALNEMTKGKWHLNITTREGRVMRQLIEAAGAKRIVEVGTSSGYSTIWLALGARATGGKVYTHEINPKMIELARANFKKAGVDDLITIIKGDAHETIKQHKDTIDLVFLDAEKKGYLDYLNQLLPLVRPGGLILGHDMHGRMPDPRYIKAITTNPKLDTSFLMMESFGFSMTTKKR